MNNEISLPTKVGIEIIKKTQDLAGFKNLPGREIKSLSGLTE